MLLLKSQEVIKIETYERIRDLRKNKLHLSQSEFGNRLGVSRSVIANIELNMLARPDQKEPLYKLICKEFGVNYEWLTSGKGEPYSEELSEDEYTKAVTEIGIKDLQARQVIIDYWKLNESDKKLFLSFIQRFVTIKKQED